METIDLSAYRSHSWVVGVDVHHMVVWHQDIPGYVQGNGHCTEILSLAMVGSAESSRFSNMNAFVGRILMVRFNLSIQ